MRMSAAGRPAPARCRVAKRKSGAGIALHVDGGVEDAGPLVGVEGGVVVVADPAHCAEVVAHLRELWVRRARKCVDVHLSGTEA